MGVKYLECQNWQYNDTIALFLKAGFIKPPYPFSVVLIHVKAALWNYTSHFPHKTYGTVIMFIISALITPYPWHPFTSLLLHKKSSGYATVILSTLSDCKQNLKAFTPFQKGKAAVWLHQTLFWILCTQTHSCTFKDNSNTAILCWGGGGEQSAVESVYAWCRQLLTAAIHLIFYTWYTLFDISYTQQQRSGKLNQLIQWYFDGE